VEAVLAISVPRELSNGLVLLAVCTSLLQRAKPTKENSGVKKDPNGKWVIDWTVRNEPWK